VFSAVRWPAERIEEVIRVSQWAEIRQMHWVDGVPRKEIARRFGLDVKTVRRALHQDTRPARRVSPARGSRLDPFRAEIEALLVADPKLSAKRIFLLLRPRLGTLCERAMRKYIARLRAQRLPEAFVHRTHAPGDTLEVDFGEAWIVLAGQSLKIKFIVATLPASNAYFAKAYRLERLESLLDGLCSALRWFAGLPRRVVLDNTSLAIKAVLAGPERIEQRTFESFRGCFPVHADFCAPAKGCEKGSVERGVRYVRDLCLRPRPAVASLDELNATILAELQSDLCRRRLPDGRTAQQALFAEREHLRPLPAHMPESCRVLPRVADKFGHVRLDKVTYSVPIEMAYRPVLAKLFHDRVEIVVAAEVVARHIRSFEQGRLVLDPRHVLPLLTRKLRAVSEASALQPGCLPAVFFELREALRDCTRKADQEWVSVLRLLQQHAQDDLELAVRQALQRGSPRLATVQMLLRRGDPLVGAIEPVSLSRLDLAGLTVAPPTLAAWDELTELCR
jgi:transposase